MPCDGFPELEREDDAWNRAMSMAAQDASAWAAELDRLVPVTVRIGVSQAS